MVHVTQRDRGSCGLTTWPSWPPPGTGQAESEQPGYGRQHPTGLWGRGVCQYAERGWQTSHLLIISIPAEPRASAPFQTATQIR